MLQKVQVQRCVDAGQHRFVEPGRLLHRAQFALLDLGQHMVDPCRHFETRHHPAAEHLLPALVQGVQLVVESDHAQMVPAYLPPSMAMVWPVIQPA